MSIYLIGGAGITNCGDQLIVRGWLDYFRDNNTADIVVDGDRAEILDQYFGQSHPQTTCVQSVSTLSKLGPRKAFWPSVRRGYRFFDDGCFDRHPEFAELDGRISEATTLHLHGGGYLNLIFPGKGFLLGFCAAARKRYGCRVVATGLGFLPQVDPNRGQKMLLHEVIDAFDLIEFRDEESATYLADLVPQAHCIAGLDDTYLIPRPELEPAERPRLHLSWFSKGESIDIATDYIRCFPDLYEEIAFWACTIHDQRQFVPHLTEIVPRLKVFTSAEIVADPFVARPGDHMLTKRFHPHLLSARCGTRGQFVAEETYYDTKHGSAVKLGSPFERMGDRVEPMPFDKSPSEIMKRDEEWAGKKRALADRIYRGASV